MFKQFILYALPVFLLLLITACENKEDKYNAFVKKADSLLKQKKYKEAKTYYMQAEKLGLKKHYAGDQIRMIDSIVIQNNKQAKYDYIIKEANKLFDEGNLTAAQNAYTNALRILPQDSLALNRLEDIKYLIAQNSETAEDIRQNPYKIIVGSFKNISNAEALQQLLAAKGLESHLIPRGNAFTAVSCASYESIRQAYNHLAETRDELQPDAWVLKDKE